MINESLRGKTGCNLRSFVTLLILLLVCWLNDNSFCYLAEGQGASEYA